MGLKESGMDSAGSGLGSFMGYCNSVLNAMIPYHAAKFLSSSGICTSNQKCSNKIISSHSVAPRCCPQGVSQVKGMHFQNVNLSMHRPHWKG